MAGQAIQGTPNLSDYDVIVVSTSAGKDSQVALDVVATLARQAGVLDRVVCVHADLGPRVEWQGVKELAQRQADHYGLPLIVTSRIGGVATRDSKVYRKGETYGDLLDYTERRGSWPSSSCRFCTSEFKRAPIQKVYTRLAKEWRERTGLRRPCRILDVQGLRAEESPARAKLEPWTERERTGTKAIDTWLPVHAWTEEQVWERIHMVRSPYHWAYDQGMGRLSCMFCVMASRRDLLVAGRLAPEALAEWQRVEEKTGHRFQAKLSLADVAEELAEESKASAA